MAASSAASQQPAGPAATVRPRAHRQSLLPPPASATILLLRLPPLARALRAAPSLPRPRRQQSMLRMMMGLGKSYTLPTPEEALPGRERPIQSGERHYVLKTPLHGPWPEGYKKLIFANGCFWGSEKGIWRLPGGGIHSTAVGYAAGFTPNPTYEEACSGKTGHTEAVQVVYDPAKTSLVDILRWFWESHDPTQGMGQGNDRGSQYRSGLYYFDDEQKALIEASAAAYGSALEKAGKGQGPITTEIRAASDYPEIFYYAEEYHQQYLAKPGARPYCSAQPQCVSLPPFAEWCPSPELLAPHSANMLPEQFWKKHGPTPHCVIRSPDAPIVWPSL